MASYKEYINLTIDYKKKYGNNTIILYRNGIFYEIYHKNNDPVSFDNVKQILSLNSSEKTGQHTTGFRYLELDEKLEILTNHNFTSIVHEKGSKDQVYSPGTFIGKNDSTILCTIHFEEGRNKGVPIAVIGISYIDLCTGRSFIYEHVCNNTDDILSHIEEKITFIKPREIIVTTREKESSLLGTNQSILPKFSVMETTLHTINNLIIRNLLNKLPQETNKESYREQVLEKVYPSRGVLSVREYLGIEHMISCEISFVHLLNVVYERNETLIKGIPTPTIENGSKHTLIFSINAPKHLNLPGLEQLINKCKTPMGKRDFTTRLLAPYTDPKTIQISYATIEKMLHLFTSTRATLEKVYDMEKYIRLMERNKLDPRDFWNIDVTLKVAKKLMVEIPFVASVVTHTEIESCIDSYRNILNLNLIHQSKLTSISDSFFNLGVHDFIDKIQHLKCEALDYFNIIKKKISNDCKLEKNNKGYSLRLSEVKWNCLKNDLGGIVDCGKYGLLDISSLEYKQVSSTSKIVELRHTIIQTITLSLMRYEEQLSSEVLSCFQEFVEEFIEKNRNILKWVTNYITQVDWYSNAAYMAHNYKYHKPLLIEESMPLSEEPICQNRGHLKVVNARHPIVEAIETRVPYIPHSIKLDSLELGILLYGENSSGKSTTIKTIGLLIIMAQCGLFVPCESMTYGVYTRLEVRVPCADDIMKGISTFDGEAGSLRQIISRSDERTLVVGDELCSGTEAESATAIVAKGIMRLRDTNTNFIFATHYHCLTKLVAIKDLIQKGVFRVYHHSVTRHPITGVKTFDRILKEGQGSRLYGLEACKSLGFDDDFICGANTFRKELLGISNDIVSKKVSRYGGGGYVDICNICGEEPATEVHHIKEQHTADKDGFIGFEHKDRRSNQVPTCQKCHDAEHHNVKTIEGYVKTTEGIKLVVNDKKVVFDEIKQSKYDQVTIESVKTQLKLGRSIKSVAIDLGLTIYAVKKIALIAS